MLENFLEKKIKYQMGGKRKLKNVEETRKT